MTPSRSHSACASPGSFANASFCAGHVKPRLEADEVVSGAGRIFFTQLHDGIGRFSGARIAQTDRLERTIPQGVLAARRHLFDRQTAFEVRHLTALRVRLEFLGLVLGQLAQIAHERLVLRAIERDVQIVGAVALIVA